MGASDIKMLGPPFTISEVFLWEDVGIITSCSDSMNLKPGSSFFCPKSYVTADDETSIKHIISGYSGVEEMELVCEMDALGLPLSFGTSKVSGYAPSRSKRKGSKSKPVSHRKELNNLVPEISCLYDIKSQTDASYNDAKEQCKCDWQSDESVSIMSLSSRNETNEKPVLVEVSDLNSLNLVKSEISSDTDCFEQSAEVLCSLSLSLHGDKCIEEVVEHTCSQTQCHHDGDLLNKYKLEKCSDDSFISDCNMLQKVNKDDTQTLQRCLVTAESTRFHSLKDYHDNFICCECGDWRVIWDPFYQCNYFFNVPSQESTWYPPPGLEKYSFSYRNSSRNEEHVVADEKNVDCEQTCGSTNEMIDSLIENGGGFHSTKTTVYRHPVEMPAEMGSGIDFVSHYSTAGNENSNVEWLFDISYAPDSLEDEATDCKDLDKKEKQSILGPHHDLTSTINEDVEACSLPDSHTNSLSEVLDSCENVAINKKHRVRRRQAKKLYGLTPCLSRKSVKYWCQRYSLFSRFDDGIKMDDESWYSVTPELLAKHHAFRCGSGTIIDCFAGVGGNAIHFALRSNHVIAIDLDPWKIDYARHNAAIYGVCEMIDFIKGDFFNIAPTLKGDAAFLSPPWGGPDYVKAQTYDIGSLKPHGGYHLFKIASMIAPKVIMFLPKNVNLDQLGDLLLSMDSAWNLEVEKNYLNGMLKSITAYFERALPD